MAAAKKKKKRKRRKGEYICDCKAYSFPHRFGGGKCSGYWVVKDYWEDHYGGGSCKHCNAYNTTDEYPHCEVVEGLERVDVCPVYDEFVNRNEIKIYSQM